MVKTIDLLLLLQSTVIFTNERADFIGQPEQLFPLFLIERHRESPQAIDNLVKEIG